MGSEGFFPSEPTVMKFHFTNSKLREKHFATTKARGKYQILNQGGKSPSALLLPTTINVTFNCSNAVPHKCYECSWHLATAFRSSHRRRRRKVYRKWSLPQMNKVYRKWTLQKLEKTLWIKTKSLNLIKGLLIFLRKNGLVWPLVVLIVSFLYSYVRTHQFHVLFLSSWQFSPFNWHSSISPKVAIGVCVFFCPFSDCLYTSRYTQLVKQCLAGKIALALAHILFDQRKSFRPHDCQHQHKDHAKVTTPGYRLKSGKIFRIDIEAVLLSRVQKWNQSQKYKSKWNSSWSQNKLNLLIRNELDNENFQ